MQDNNKIEDAQILDETTTTKVETVNQVEPSNKVKNASNVSIISLDRSTGKPDLSKYTPQEIQKFTAMGNALKTTDSQSILNYGLELQNKLAGHSDAFLSNVRSFDAGEIGGSINNLLSEVNYIDIDPSQQSGLKRFMLQIPGLKNLVMSTKKIFQK